MCRRGFGYLERFICVLVNLAESNKGKVIFAEKRKGVFYNLKMRYKIILVCFLGVAKLVSIVINIWFSGKFFDKA